MKIPIYQVDAFTQRMFSGNPAAVCPLDKWLPAEQMQNIASENNLSETAFFVPYGSDYSLRWFTPSNEVTLCGHATLASAHVIFEYLQPDRNSVCFASRSGELMVQRQAAGLLELDFPSKPGRPMPELAGAVADALGVAPSELLVADDAMAIFDSQEVVARLQPDFSLLAQLPVRGVIATAVGMDCDFVSRFFAPQVGVQEDPVTGSAHCTLAPYWSEKLSRKQMHAKQISPRGGELWCKLLGDRVKISGHAVTYLQGYCQC